MDKLNVMQYHEHYEKAVHHLRDMLWRYDNGHPVDQMELMESLRIILAIKQEVLETAGALLNEYEGLMSQGEDDEVASEVSAFIRNNSSNIHDVSNTSRLCAVDESGFIRPLHAYHMRM